MRYHHNIMYSVHVHTCTCTYVSTHLQEILANFNYFWQIQHHFTISIIMKLLVHSVLACFWKLSHKPDHFLPSTGCITSPAQGTECLATSCMVCLASIHCDSPTRNFEAPHEAVTIWKSLEHDNHWGEPHINQVYKKITVLVYMCALKIRRIYATCE